jgi:hypothetical protein
MAGGYRYRRVQVSGTDRYHDKPEKNHFSHVAEAGQYLMLGGGEGRAIVKRTTDGKQQTMAEPYDPLAGIPSIDNPAGRKEYDPFNPT